MGRPAGSELNADGLNPALQNALDKFTLDVTAKARDGQIDPVFGRDMEIRQMVDILSRRRKNNPILVGEPGVGKTALVEGLALRIAEGNVPDALKPVSVRTLDLGLLQAGAGVKGEFEQRLKNIIEAVQQSPSPVLLFIDEAHTIIGAGNQAGGADAANLLKPRWPGANCGPSPPPPGVNTSSTSSATPRWSAAFRWSRWMSRTTTPPA